MDIINDIHTLEKNSRELEWEGTFRDYMELVAADPALCRKACRRVYDMIVSAGWEDTPRGRSYLFFSEEMFGIEETLRILVEEYLKPAALGTDVKNRILLLMGPVGTGKSSIVSLIKRGLEEYSKTPHGAFFGIKGCPMHEEPLHLIPYELRGRLREKGVDVEGSLCPRCRIMVEQDYAGRVEDVPVERVFISEEKRVGIGTFVPSDPKSQDMAELTGSVDFSTIAEYGAESDPRAYRFDGELNKANRGVMEFHELLKCDEKFLYSLLSLAQERNFKAGRFALISADELVIGHTNTSEYKEFIGSGRNEALASRLYVVPVPYNLCISQEEKIYRKLLGDSLPGDVHLAPYALRTPAMFSVLTRLKEPCRQGISIVKKALLYEDDGLMQGGSISEDVEELRQEAGGEGMEGIDPRYVVNRICSAIANSPRKCVSSLDILESLKKGLGWHPLMEPGDTGRLERLLLIAEDEYYASVRKDVARACMRSYPGTARQVFTDYMNGICSWIKAPNKERKDHCADTGLMDFIESFLGVSGSGKQVFREEIYNRSLKYAAMGRDFDYTAHPGLREGVEAEVLRRILNGKADLDQASKARPELTITEVLIRDFGYCPLCAREAVSLIYAY